MTREIKKEIIKNPCPNCGNEMEYKFELDDGSEDGLWRTKIYQCPKCKNIESK